MNLCKLFKIVALITLVGAPLSLVFGGVLAFIITAFLLLYLLEETDKP